MSSVARRRLPGRAAGDRAVVEAAWLYYQDGLNQSEIADRMGVSRSSVVNYLQEARERNYVRVTLADTVFRGHAVAQALRAAAGVADVLIVPDGADSDETLRRVGRGTADWLPSLLAPGDRLGVAWGQTVYEVASALERQRIDDLVVHQLVGSMATPYGFTAEICSAVFAERLGAACVNLHTPAILSSAELAARLREEPIISNQLAAISQCSKAIFAAGSSAPESHVISSGVATLGDLAHYKAKGAVGVLCGRFIDDTGMPVDGPLNDRIMGVSLDKLTGLEMGLLVSCGKDKVAPMLAAIRGGYVTHIVTSEDTATAMLDAMAGDGAL